MLTVELRSDDASVALLSLDGDARQVTDLVAHVADGPPIHSTFTGPVHTALGSTRALDDPEESEAVRDILFDALAAAGEVVAFDPLFVRTERPSATFDRLTVWDDDVATDFALTDGLAAAGTSAGAKKAWRTRHREGPHHEGFLDLPHQGRRTEAQAKAARDKIAADLAAHPERDDARAAVLGKLDSGGDATTIARHDRLKGNKWSRERAKLHAQIVARHMADAADVPNDNQAVLLGGLTGSGKTTLTDRPELGIDRTKYMYIDPDVIKQDLLDTPGAVDRVPGMSEGEHASIVHKESTHIVDQLIAEAMKSGKNVIIDRTMSESPDKEIKALRKHKYSVHGVFADITVNEALTSADIRWRVKNGRFVPEPFIEASRTPDARSKNLLKFKSAMPKMTDWAIVNQDGISKGKPKGTIRRGRGAAQFAADVMVFRSIDYEQVTGVPHPGTPVDQADAVEAGDRVAVDGPAGLALLYELGNRPESSDLTLVTIANQANIFGSVKANQLRRVDMPQIPPEHLDDFADHLRAVGVGVRATQLDPLELRATQNELDGRKTGQMIRSMEQGTMVAPPVWVSSDGFVLDGTHRWAAEAVLAGAEPRRMKVCQAAAPMAILLPMARAFADGAGIDSKTHGMTLRPFAFKGTSEGARLAWESRKRAKESAGAPAPAAPSVDSSGPDAAGLDARIKDLQTEMAPSLSRIREIQTQMNKDSFYRLSDYQRNHVYNEAKQLRADVADRVAEVNALAKQRMDATFESTPPPADYDADRWNKVDLDLLVPHPHGGTMRGSAKVDHPEFGEAGIQATYDELLADRIKKSGPFREPKPDQPSWMSKKTIAEQQADLRAEAERITAEYGSPKFLKARDRWVVADVPTLELNAGLRGDIPMTPGLKRRAGEAKMLTSGTLAADTKLSRSMELPPAVAASLKPGSVFESKGYMATQAGGESSYNRSEDAPGTIHTVATILAPKGTHAGDVGYGETILRPGRMRVIDSAWDGTTHRVTMEYLND